ncbi:MAG: alpha-1 2-mannosidase [Saprospiraceae bacterium]|nr:MAG: alpha-1 2-mannosidase [Saprospiraceae bacterium]
MTMINLPYSSMLFLILLIASCQQNESNETPNHQEGINDLSVWVDPFIGTAEHGHVYPGATVPFGAVQLSPDNGTPGWDWCAGYNWADSIIVGFSHTHLSGTGIGDLYDILMMPALGTIDFSQKLNSPREAPYASTFQHANETASPGFYSVQLDNGISVNLTSTLHTGFHEYLFPEGDTAALVLDLGYALNWDRPLETRIRLESDTLITGYRFSTGWAKDQRVFFAMALSHPFNSHQLADSTLLQNGSLLVGQKGRLALNFGTLETLKVKVGISSISREGALKGLEEIPGWDIDEVRLAAQNLWNQELNKVIVTTDNQPLKKVFYTALYRTNLAPVVFTDVLGYYKGVDNAIHQVDYTRYDIFSLWDTFRAAHPLFTLLQQDRIDDMIRSMLSHYDEYGLLPVWSLLGNETNTMTGYHAIPIITDAYLKGFRGFDAEKAFTAMKRSAMQDIRGSNFYREYGYIPYDKDGESVTKTLEYAYDDWCIAQMAKAMGKDDEYKTFMKRSESFKPLFDASTGFMRAKLSDGTWKKPFDPQYSDHNFDVAEYTEGNAWQHSWFVPHDVPALIDLHGGIDPFIQKLDSLFSIDSEIRGDFTSADISGLIGQYAHGNEPSHHIAYLYNYAGTPWKTQEKVHEIINTQYNTSPAGLCGNEDCGQMSAWYVFSAIGFYPVNPASGIYVIGTPAFQEVQLNTGGSTTFTVKAEGISKENFYIQSASLNGQPLKRSYITHEEILKGGTLVFQMGAEANTSLWNSPDAYPPAMAIKER